MLTLEDDPEPTWPGWWNGEGWFDASSGSRVTSTVTAWADMPAGYRQ